MITIRHIGHNHCFMFRLSIKTDKEYRVDTLISEDDIRYSVILRKQILLELKSALKDICNSVELTKTQYLGLSDQIDSFIFRFDEYFHDGFGDRVEGMLKFIEKEDWPS